MRVLTRRTWIILWSSLLAVVLLVVGAIGISPSNIRPDQPPVPAPSGIVLEEPTPQITVAADVKLPVEAAPKVETVAAPPQQPIAPVQPYIPEQAYNIPQQVYTNPVIPYAPQYQTPYQPPVQGVNPPVQVPVPVPQPPVVGPVLPLPLPDVTGPITKPLDPILGPIVTPLKPITDPILGTVNDLLPLPLPSISIEVGPIGIHTK